MDQKTAFVTGAAAGIGFAIARRLALDGHHVVCIDRQPTVHEAAASINAELKSANTRAELLDIADEAAVTTLVDRMVAERGGVDIVVNNAGIIRGGPDFDLTKTTLAHWQKVLDVNLTGAFLMCRAAVPSMRARGWGRIVNVASRAGRTGVAEGGLHYAASKAGLIGMTRTLALQCAPQGITANCVAPGRVTTALTRVATPAAKEAALQRIPLGREGTPDEIAGVVAFLCSDDGAYVTGAVVDANGGAFMG